MSSQPRPRVLYVSHNHPSVRVGGAETYAYELFQAVRDAGEFDPIFLTKAGPPFSQYRPNRDTRLGLVDGDPREYCFYTEPHELDPATGAARSKRLYVRDWRWFLEALRPDLVHFQHTMFLGPDILRMTRRVLQRVPIVYTLHEFMPICHQNGKMVRSAAARGVGPRLCDRASPARCHECFPAISPQTFFLRERFIKAALEAVDLFIAPSRQLRQRYLEWGIPAEKLRYEDYGRLPHEPLGDAPDAGRRRRIGFFGQITPYKGVDVLLSAMRLLERERAEVELLLHGGNLEFAPEPFRAWIRSEIVARASSVSYRGGYEHRRFPDLVAGVDWVVVPSTWWENSPLVIQEALMARRPVICSDVGGMAEKVRPGVDGLHFRVGDARSLADVMRLAADSPELWTQIHERMRAAHPMAQHLATLGAIYRQLLGCSDRPSDACFRTQPCSVPGSSDTEWPREANQ